jgi:hypothetical protein
MHELNDVCLCWLNGAKWSKPACNPSLITLDQITRTSVALCADWTWPVWPVRGIGLTSAAQSCVLAGPDRSDRSAAPVWPALPSQHTSLCFVHILSCASRFLFCRSHMLHSTDSSSHAYSSKFVLLAFEANFLKFNSRHKLRGMSHPIFRRKPNASHMCAKITISHIW